MEVTNKFGELSESVCPSCGESIKPEWVACPGCGSRLKEKDEHEADLAEKGRKGSRFVCPGCGEKVTASDGRLCKKCNTFVHTNCMKSTDVHKKKVLFHSESKWICRCPVCDTVLCHAYNNFDHTGTHYVNK